MTDPSDPCEVCGGLDAAVLAAVRSARKSGPSVRELHDNAERTNCPGCRLMDWITSDYLQRRKGPGWSYSRSVCWVPATESTPFRVIIDAADGNNRYGDPMKDRKFKDTIIFEIFTDYGQEAPWTAIQPWRRVPSDTSMLSPAHLDNVHSWMTKCAREHPECGTPIDVDLPDRVLDVGPSNSTNDPVLLRSRGMQGKYICLSHSWGSSQPIKTTQASLGPFSQSGIPWTSLPRTFQDAVSLTRNLGLRYLWIDSLCIVQDDPQDWEVQASRMADIYGKAFLTAAATHSDGANTGLVPPIDPGLQERRVPSTLLPTAAPPIWYRRSLPHYQLQKSMEHPSIYSGEGEADGNGMHETTVYPLLGRSWTFQEHLLTARVVQFTCRELVWECARRMWCCCTPDDPTAPGRSGMKGAVAHLFAPVVDAVPGPRPGFDVLCETWKEVVVRYNNKAITNCSDRLPALSGMAKRAKRVLRAEYLAGMWSRNVEAQLCWSISEGSVLQRTWGLWTPEYRAPSWSWASVEGPVQWNPPSTAPGHFRILEAQCTPSDLDPTGKVRDGHLLVEGLVVEGVFGRGDSPSLRSPRQYRFVVGGRSVCFDPDVPFFMIPYDQFLPLGTTLHCLATGKVPNVDDDFSGPETHCNYLVLLAAGEDQDGAVFQRIGWVNEISYRGHEMGAVFDGSVKRRILII